MSKVERGKLILAILGTIGAIAVLLTLFGCGSAIHKPLHPIPDCTKRQPWGPEPTCDCRNYPGYEWSFETQQCEKQK